MARIRTIKPEFPQSESIGRLSREARLLFILLWTIADDAGRLRGALLLLLGLLYPYDQDAGDHIETWLVELEREGCIQCYEVDRATYIQISNWKKHQRIDKPTPSKLPQIGDDSRPNREDSRVAREDSRVLLAGSGLGSGSGPGYGSGPVKGKGEEREERETRVTSRVTPSVTRNRELAARVLAGATLDELRSLRATENGQGDADASS